MVLFMEPTVEGQRSAVIKLSGELVRLRTSVLIYGCNSNASAYILDTGCSGQHYDLYLYLNIAADLKS